MLYTWRIILSLSDTNGRLVACVQITKNRMFPLNLNTKIEKCLIGLIENESHGGGIYALAIFTLMA
jgi:hypothetical protein